MIKVRSFLDVLLFLISRQQ